MTDTKSKELFEFKKALRQLRDYSGRGTELISLFITPGYAIHEVVAKLRDEYSQASNIKSKSTQKNVQSALEKLMAFLKNFRKTPDNGIAIFCGDVSPVAGRADIQLFSVVPPFPLATQFYRCESRFVLQPLEDMLEHTGTYGLVVLDGKDATIALLRGKELKVLRHLHSTAQQKMHKGGQSAARFQRIHEETTEKYYQRVGEAMAVFLEMKNLQGIVVGGPGPTKEYFLDSKPFNYQLKILGVVDTGYADEQGLKEVMEKAGDILKEQEAVKEKKLVSEFIGQIAKNGLAVYGLEKTQESLDAKRVDKLLVTEDMELYECDYSCDSCGKNSTRVSESKESSVPCQCGQHIKVGLCHLRIEDLLEEAEAQGITVEYISKETDEGKQFHASFKGIGAFLRY
ncbi:peptide chain release factor 1 [Candidatus Micrarchaeota archaeon]|nr:peptide chain release factor 1 [Candidatus Micrarchaeota archaeon]